MRRNSKRCRKCGPGMVLNRRRTKWVCNGCGNRTDR